MLTVKLNFAGAQLDIEEVTRTLGLNPYRIARKGDRILGHHKGRHQHQTHLWCWASSTDEVPLETKLLYLLDILEPHAHWLQRLISSGISASVELDIWDGQAIIDISSDILGRLAYLKLDLHAELWHNPF
jgi:hypothetical protein